MKTRKTSLSTLLVWVMTACATAPQAPTSNIGDEYTYTREHMQWLVREKMRKHNIVGMSIAIVDDQEIVWAEGFGFSDKQNLIPATSYTIYRAGSITKLFTATAVMQLSESGQLDIDQTLQAWLPEFRIRSRFESTESITPRNIMTHHSGLPSDRHNGSWGDETADFTELAALLKDEYVATPPNTIESYSNLGFALLGNVIERVSGEKYADYIENQVLRPAGMQHAYIASNLKDDKQSSKGYTGKKSFPTPTLRDLPAGGLNSSVVDLARFAQMTFANGGQGSNQVLLPQSLAEMQNFQDIDGTFDIHPSVGLGWRLVDGLGEDAGVMAGHNGGTPMFHSEFLSLPKHRLAVVVLANSDTAAGITHEIAMKALKLALESKTGIKVSEPVKLKAHLKPLPEDLERLPGYWSTPMGLVQIQRKGDRLKFEVDGHKLNLVRREDGYYHLDYKLFGLLSVNLGNLARVGLGYLQIAGREVLAFYVNGEPRNVVAEKVQAKPLPASWTQSQGHYVSINARGTLDMKSVQLKIEDNMMLVSSTIAFDSNPVETSTDVLWPVSDTEAVIHGLGRNKGETVRLVEENEELLLSYSGFLLRRKN